MNWLIHSSKRKKCLEIKQRFGKGKPHLGAGGKYRSDGARTPHYEILGKNTRKVNGESQEIIKLTRRQQFYFYIQLQLFVLLCCFPGKKLMKEIPLVITVDYFSVFKRATHLNL